MRSQRYSGMALGLIVLGLLCLPVRWGAAEPLRVALLSSDTSLPYKNLSDALSAKSQQPGSVFKMVSAHEGHDLLLTTGSRALEMALGSSKRPILALMLPQSGYQALLSQAGPRAVEISAVYLDQPRDRQMRFVRALFPKFRKVGLLYSPALGSSVAAWSQAAADSDLRLVSRAAGAQEDLFGALEEVLNETDVLLATPDTAVYNSNSIRNILLASYRWRIPMVGFSQGYVNAGAVGAIFSTPEQIAHQAGHMIVAYLKSGRLPQGQFPQDYEVAINYQVARSLGLEIPSVGSLKQQIGNAGGKQ